MEIGKNYEAMLGALEKMIRNAIGKRQDMPYHYKTLPGVYSIVLGISQEKALCYKCRKPISGELTEQGLGLRLVMRYSVDGKPAAQMFWFHAHHYLDVSSVLETLENSKNFRR